MRAVVRVLLTLILLIAAGLLSYDLASYYLYSPWTRDARIRRQCGFSRARRFRLCRRYSRAE
jgi:multidrug resistance efflux pump